LKELAILGWVVLGLRLRKTPFRTLLGSFRWSLRSVALDLAIALGFWIASLMVLGACGFAWLRVEAAITHHPEIAHVAGQPLVPSPSQRQTLRTLTELAPATGEEIAAWTLLCILVGFIEEVVFRGYLQRQFCAWAHGGLMAGVLLSALVFGGAHGYEGARGIFLLAVFGILFSVLAIDRRSLRPGMFAHTWHDVIVGLTLALLKSHHLI
jgi:membrane protease YdiL (CAAX protease family)